jgi:hypothetical protein
VSNSAVVRVAQDRATPRTEADFAYPVAWEATESGIIIINYPGYNGSMDGFEDKYVKISHMLTSRGIGSVVRTHNMEDADIAFDRLSVARLRSVIDFSLHNSMEICGSDNPDLYIMGHSAGASAIAVVLGDYVQIKKALLTSPATTAGADAMRQGITAFKGELYVTVGSRESWGFRQAAKRLSALAQLAVSCQFVQIPRCDHQFRGERNGMILSKAPLWAFAGDDTFPDPAGGEILY